MITPIELKLAEKLHEDYLVDDEDFPDLTMDWRSWEKCESMSQDTIDELKGLTSRLSALPCDFADYGLVNTCINYALESVRWNIVCAQVIELIRDTVFE